MGVSKNRDTPKWVVYNRNPYQNGWFGVTTIFGNIHILVKLDGATEQLPKLKPRVGNLEVSSSGLNVQVSGTTAACEQCPKKPPEGGWCPDPSTKGGHSVATFNPETLGWIVGWDPKNNPLWVRIWFNSQTRCIVSRDFVGWSEGQKSLEHREHFARFLQRVLTSPNVLNAFQFSRKAELADWISEDTFCRILFILARSSEITTMFQVPFQRLEWDLFTPGTWASLSGNRAFI